MNSGFGLVIFDWDGTLMDSEAHIVDSMQAAMRDLELEILAPATIRDIIGLGMREAVQALFPERDEEGFFEAFTHCYRNYYFHPEQPPALFPGAHEALEELREGGYVLAVATGKSRKGLDLALAETGIGSLFHASRCAEETRSKPDPRMLDELLRECSFRPEQAVMVGDTEFDLEMARRAGVASVAVCFGVHAAERLRQYEPLGCIDRLTDLPDLLGPNSHAPGYAPISRTGF